MVLYRCVAKGISKMQLPIYINGKVVEGGSWVVNGTQQNGGVSSNYLYVISQTVGVVSLYTTDPIDLSEISKIYIKKKCTINGVGGPFDFRIGSKLNLNDLLSVSINDKLTGTNIIDISNIQNKNKKTCYLSFYSVAGNGSSYAYEIHNIEGKNY